MDNKRIENTAQKRTAEYRGSLTSIVGKTEYSSGLRKNIGANEKYWTAKKGRIFERRTAEYQTECCRRR
jgi:hypothetical protein